MRSRGDIRSIFKGILHELRLLVFAVRFVGVKDWHHVRLPDQNQVHSVLDAPLLRKFGVVVREKGVEVGLRATQLRLPNPPPEFRVRRLTVLKYSGPSV